MKTPEQANYPTPKNKFKETQQYIESCIDEGNFTGLSYHKINKSKALEEWLAEYGWKLNISYGQRDEEYISLTPLEL